MNRRPFKSVLSGSRRDDFPTMTEATAKAKKNCAVLFYERGFFGLVWFENKIRRIRELKSWAT